MATSSETPARQQYLQIKAQYPDVIVLFRLGDFYETFDDDAKIVAQVCDIVLTSRPVGGGQRVPLAGVPYHAIDGYVAKLIHAGYKVAVVDQLGNTPVKGLVPREVSRVVTPGTVIEPMLLDEKRNNYLCALVVDGQRAGVAYTDITTGEFAATELHAEGQESVWRWVREELARLQAAELLIPQGWSDVWTAQQNGVDVHVSRYEDWHFELENARQALLEQFKVASLAGFGCEGKPLAIRAAGAIVYYLRETQKAALDQLALLTTYSSLDFMTLDPATRRNLELVQTIREGKARGSLLGVLDETRTAMGGRLLRQWLTQPLLDLGRLNRRLDAVQTLVGDTPLRVRVRDTLKNLPDLERLIGRVVQRIAGPRDLVGVRKALETAPLLRAALEGVVEPVRAISDLLGQLDGRNDVASLIAEAIVDDAPVTLAGGDLIRPGFSAELDNLLLASRDAKTWIANLEKTERQKTGIKNLKVGYNKVFGYYIEVTQSNLDAAPQSYIRKQTLVNAERFITPELKEYEALVLNAEERKQEIETRLFREVCERVAAAAEPILRTARALARLDVFAVLAEVAVSNRYVRPTLADNGDLCIVAGRHPVVELTMRAEPFIPNDTRMSADEAVHIITGPNMSGKSTFIRQVALIVLMAQIGSFVPADEAQIGLVDRIFTRIGAQDEISAGQSTFMVEMVEAAYILNHATSRSLLILDEIGRGTSTYDGISIAWSIVEYVHNHPRLGSKTLFATHYHELTDLERILPRVRNYNVAVSEQGDRVVFLHHIVPGGADKSYGIHVAQLAGMPRPVVHRAEEILAELEKEAAETMPARAGGKRARPRVQVLQLPLFGAASPVVDELKQLDVNAMSPIEALTKLFELHKMANQE
ncbi:MAG: DNA mismatch repair protein MutS [Anaerolineae bacterium]|nr:DNA mismatch repair protein MutS [Anaerolineae bacterium]